MDSTLVGASGAFFALQQRIDRVAPTQATVLLVGERGVGKSLIAREVHRRSARALSLFVEVNCSAIPEQLIEAELFGAERGAFSGASHSRTGRFESATGGTVFLDEIAALNMTVQGKLLRVIQTGEVERLGNSQTTFADVRVIAATNEDLKAAVQDGRFREDLYFRLHVFPIVVQPLRERREDIPPLIDLLLARFAERHRRRVTGIAPRALQALIDHTWPGNVRELESVLERGVIMIQGEERIDIHHLSSVDDRLTSPISSCIWRVGQSASRSAVVSDQPAQDVDEQRVAMSVSELAEALVRQGSASLPALEEALLRAAVKHTAGNISRAASILGLSRSQLDYRYKKIECAERRSGESEEVLR